MIPPAGPPQRIEPGRRLTLAPAQAFAAALKALRRRHGLTQDQLADRADLDRSHISQLERGLRAPSLDTLLRVASGLGISFVMLALAIQEALDPAARPNSLDLVRTPDLRHLPPKPGKPGRRATHRHVDKSRTRRDDSAKDK